MNKYQESWNFLMGDGKMNVDKWGESLDTIHELVEKATPKKAEQTKYAPYHTFCSACGGLVFDNFDYCPKCGQALDWSEENVD